MKPLSVLLAVLALFALGACHKQPGGIASNAASAKSGALPKPQAPATTAPPAAPIPSPPGAPSARLELDGLYIGLDIASTRKHIPSDWKGEPRWAPNGQDSTGVITCTAPTPPAQKGAISPPAVVTYFFFEGKLVAALQVKPGTSQADYDRWVADSNTKYGPSGTGAPDFAKNCEFLSQLKFPPPDGVNVVWNNVELQQVLALQFSPSMGLAQYMLVDVAGSSKVQQAIMSAPGPVNATPPAAPPGG
jgi:hypothetical protein